MTDTTHEPHYKLYFKVWLVLLAITVLMVFVRQPMILIPGILLKAGIIALWFMHLKDESLDFILTITLCILGFSAVLFFLLVSDGMAM